MTAIIPEEGSRSSPKSNNPRQYRIQQTVMKFAKRVTIMGPNKTNSCLNLFGSTFVERKGRGKIGVQPQLRRTGDSKSSQRQDNRGNGSKRNLPSQMLPERKVKPKQKHNIADTTRPNKPPAKKSGVQAMKSTRVHRRPNAGTKK